MSRSSSAVALLTGGSGFIGTHLIRKLVAEKVPVRVLLRPDSVHADRLKNADAEIVRGDLADPDAVHAAVQSVKCVYHLGAATSSSDRDTIQRSNIEGTEHLIRACVAHGVERFVLISDTEAYDLFHVAKGTKIDEEAPLQNDPRTMSFYTYSKIENEKQAFKAFREHGLPITVIRPGMVVGAMGQIFFPHLGYRYKDKLFLVVGSGNNVLPFTMVENFVEGVYLASIEPRAVGQIYNLVDELKVTVRDYLEQLIEVTGTRPRIVSIPYWLPYLAITAYEIGASLGVLKKGATSRAQFRWKHAPMPFDNTKAKNELKWAPKVTAKQGLASAFRWFAEQGEREGSRA